MSAPATLNILFVGTLPPYPGGSAISGSQLLAGFANLGHKVRAVAAITPAALQAGDAFAANHRNVEVFRFPVPSFDFDHTKPLDDAYRSREGDLVRSRVATLIEDARPDVIVIGRESFALHVTGLARAHSIPCLLRTAGGLTSGILDRAIPHELATRLLGAYRQADLIVSPAEHLATRLRHELGFNNVRVVANAVDLDAFAPRPKSRDLLRQLAIPDDAVVVLHASNLVTSKQPLDIVHSAEAVVRAMPNITYVIVGDGPLREAMEEACRQRRIAGKFRFVGWVSYERMPEYMNLADVFIMPAQTETQARVYLEAQACARLLLASDIAAAREVIVDGQSGLLFRQGDTEDLARKTVAAARDAALRVAVGHQAHISARTHGLSDAVQAYIALIEEIISER